MEACITIINDWLKSQSALEIWGALTTILGVYLAAKNNKWNWPIALVGIAIYGMIFYEAKLYADMGLQFYFMATSFYGWYFWNQKSNLVEVKVRSINNREALISVIAVIVFTVMLGYTLKKQTDAFFPFIDSFCAACSIVAQFFLARKIIENWLIWIFVNVIYVVVYINKRLDVTAGLYIILIGIAIIGYLDWRKIYRAQQKDI